MKRNRISAVVILATLLAFTSVSIFAQHKETKTYGKKITHVKTVHIKKAPKTDAKVVAKTNRKEKISAVNKNTSKVKKTKRIEVKSKSLTKKNIHKAPKPHKIKKSTQAKTGKR